jgi:hypothetical protein
MILALLQLKNGRMKRGSLSLRKPSTGFRKTATRSELDTSGAKSPTKMLYSLGYCGFWAPGIEMVVPENGTETGAVGIEDAQFMVNGLEELGIVTAFVPLLFTWDKTEAACM